jgi:hypothetical protein
LSSIEGRGTRRNVLQMTMPAEIDARWVLPDPAQRGYHVVYRPDQVNHCPGCGGRQWFIGRVSAECAYCAIAIPLATASLPPRHAPIFVHRLGRDYSLIAA